MELPLLLYIGVICNSILVVINRFSKMVRYIPTVNTVNTTDIEVLITDYIILKFRVPKLIISDRRSIFISSY